MADIVRATPDNERITHDLLLTDGEKEIGLILCNSQGKPLQGGAPWSLRQSGTLRTSLQIRQGDADYSDYQLPYTPMTQKNWSGGRGSEDFENDKSRYADGYRLDTSMGDIILGGRETEVLLGISNQYIEPVSLTEPVLGTATGGLRFASKFIPSTSMAITSILLYLTPGASCKVEIIKDSSGVPSSVSTDIVGQQTYNVPELLLSSNLYGSSMGSKPIGMAELGHGIDVDDPKYTRLITIPITCSLDASTTYWVVITTSVIGCGALTGGIVKKETSPNTWSTQFSDQNIYFKISAINQGTILFFKYKESMYAVVKQDNGTQSRLYLNGYRFVAATGSTQSVIKIPAGQGITANLLAGCVLLIIGGTCYGEAKNFRKIVSNTTTDIVLDSGFLNTPDNTTQVVILGLNKWIEITGTGLSSGVTNVLVANDRVFFCQGEATTIRKMREYNSSGTWTREFADEGTTKATFLNIFKNSIGNFRIWKFNNPVDGSSPTASYAKPTSAFTGTMDFATKPSEIGTDQDYPIVVGDSRSKITNVVPYGEPIIPYVMKEDEFGSISYGNYAPMPIDELNQVKHPLNGTAAIQFGLYLYFNILDGLERYYDSRLDDIGPNNDQGLPETRQGYISSIVSYPGGLYMSIDADVDGYSSILYWNTIGYNEVYRAPFGQRIRSMFMQVIPGTNISRLWVGLSDRTVWIPITLNPRKQTGYQFVPSGSLESAWFNGGFKEINKFWRSIQIFAENLSSGQTISMEYQTDVSDNWYPLPSIYDRSPMQEVLMSDGYSVYGKRWRYRITLSTNDPSKSPRVKAITVPAVTRLPPNKAWSITVLADDALVDHQGKKQIVSAKELIDQLETWAQSEETPLPLTMHCPISLFDGKKVFIESPTIQPVEVVNGKNKSVKAVMTITLYEA